MGQQAKRAPRGGWCYLGAVTALKASRIVV
jgi:hypothetical protein